MVPRTSPADVCTTALSTSLSGVGIKLLWQADDTAETHRRCRSKRESFAVRAVQHGSRAYVKARPSPSPATSPVNGRSTTLQTENGLPDITGELDSRRTRCPNEPRTPPRVLANPLAYTDERRLHAVSSPARTRAGVVGPRFHHRGFWRSPNTPTSWTSSARTVVHQRAPTVADDRRSRRRSRAAQLEAGWDCAR